jgi:hypothetical protein
VKPHASSDSEGFRSNAEIIRRREVSRIVAALDLSPEEAGAVELMSRSLVDGLLRGPISDAMRHPGNQEFEGRH